MLGFLYGRGLTVRDGGLVVILSRKLNAAAILLLLRPVGSIVPQAEATLFERIDPTA